MRHVGAAVSDNIWWTGPSDEDCVEIHLKANEATIWQYRGGELSSVTVSAETAVQIARYLITHLDRRN